MAEDENEGEVARNGVDEAAGALLVSERELDLLKSDLPLNGMLIEVGLSWTLTGTERGYNTPYVLS